MTEPTFERITEIPDDLRAPNGIPNGYAIYSLAHDGCTGKERNPEDYPTENNVRDYLAAKGEEFSIIGLRTKNGVRSCLIAIYCKEVAEVAAVQT